MALPLHSLLGISGRFKGSRNVLPVVFVYIILVEQKHISGERKRNWVLVAISTQIRPLQQPRPAIINAFITRGSLEECGELHYISQGCQEVWKVIVTWLRAPRITPDQCWPSSVSLPTCCSQTWNEIGIWSHTIWKCPVNKPAYGGQLTNRLRYGCSTTPYQALNHKNYVRGHLRSFIAIHGFPSSTPTAAKNKNKSRWIWRITFDLARSRNTRDVLPQD